MNPLMERFFDKPRGIRVALVFLSFALVVGLPYQFLLAPFTEEQRELEQQREDLKVQIRSEHAIAANLPQYQQEVGLLEEKLRIAVQELPDAKDIPDLLKSIADRAKDSGLEVLLFRPEAEQRKEFFAEFPVTMSVEGSFHQVATFFDEVSRMPRIVNVRGIEISNPRQGDRGMLVKADFSAVTFRSLSEAERAEAAQQASASKSRLPGGASRMAAPATP